MQDLSGTPVPPHPAAIPHPAASVLLLRDAPEGPEVFMVLRSPRLSFSSGALGFPGGKVDPDDALHDRREAAAPLPEQIGRASCRERVGVRVAAGMEERKDD